MDGKIKLLFGEPRGQTESSKEVCRLLKEYSKKFNDSFSTECLNFTDGELSAILKYCIDNNVNIDTVIPGIDEYEEDTDY
ncbi:hypothetical protein [Inconstantimicrobium mannanitabidum]|uniref:Uncharacterized protein n=1 Tax=Inconstantimicrobium mannanitabidum TaxID=1604901 RepID=A0ACB5R883_9CLOT|nr:hypothetical protein [Clostridium sp. TW13]GKX65218.1 hypothetical protein rsdtw13_04760 [Clostridium sp. TW13]